VTGVDISIVPQGPGESPMFRRDRFERMIMARMRSGMLPTIDDRGTMIDQGLDEKEAFKQAHSSFRGFIAGNPDQHDAIRSYLAGQSEDMPQGWDRSGDAQDVGEGQMVAFVLPSQQTLEREEREAYETQAHQTRNDWKHRTAPMGMGGAGADWALENAYDAVDIASRFLSASVQIPLDVIVGTANLLGAEATAPDIEAASRSVWKTVAKGVTGRGFDPMGDYQDQKMEMHAMRATATGFTGFAGDVGELYADIKTMITNPISRVPFSVGGKVGAKLGGIYAKAITLGQASPWFTKVGTAAGAGAGSFGAYEWLVARGPDDTPPTLEDRGEAFYGGALAGATIGLAGLTVRAAMGKWLEKGVKNLATEERTVLQGLENWAKKAGVTPKLETEGTDAYYKALVAKWVDAGAPGAQMATAKIMNVGMKALVEGGAFSMLDQKFREDATRAIVDHDFAAFERAVRFYGVNAVAIGGLNVPLSNLPYYMRRSGLVGERPQGPPQGPGAEQPPKGVDQQTSPESLETSSRALERSNQAERTDPSGQGELDPWVDYSQKQQSKMDAEDAAARKKFIDRLSEGDKAEWSKIDLTLREEQKKRQAEAKGFIEEAEAAIEMTSADLFAIGVTPKPRAATDKKPATIWFGIDGTDMGYEVVKDPTFDPVGSQLPGRRLGGRGRPNKALRDALELPAEMDAIELAGIVHKAALVSALRSKTLLTGHEIDSRTGARAEVPDPSKPGVMRMIRNGRLYEAPLTPEFAWRRAQGNVPVRKPDPLPRDQEQAVQDLITILDHRRDIIDSDRALLSTAIETLGTVSRERDLSVKEAMDFLPHYFDAIAQGPPEVAGRAITALAESLTTKAPELIVQQESMQSSQRQGDAVRRQSLEQETTTFAESTEGLEGKSAKVRLRPEVAGQMARFVPKDTKLGKRLRFMSEQGDVKEASFTPQELASLASKMLRWVDQGRSARAGAELKKFDNLVSATEAKLREVAEGFGIDTRTEAQKQRDSRKDEGGFIDLEGAGEAISKRLQKVRDAVDEFLTPKDGSKGAAGYAATKLTGSIFAPLFRNPLVEGWTRDLLTKVFDVVGQETADRFGNVEANSKRVSDQLDPGLKELGETARKRNKELEDVIWEGDAGFTKSHAYKEDHLSEKFGLKRERLSERSQAELEIHDRVTKEIRKIAARLGVTMRGGNTVAAETNRNVMTRQMTARVLDAMVSGGTLRETLFRQLAKLNGLSIEAVEKMFEHESWTEHRGIKKIDPIEVARTLKFFPDHVRLPTGEVVKVLETNLYRHAQRMVKGASMRLGTIEEFGADAPKEGDPNAPSRYTELIDSYPSGVQRDTMAMALRASMGMAITKPKLHPDSLTYRVLHGLYQLADVAAAAKMTLSPLINITEPLGTASAMLGFDRVVPQLAHVWSEIAKGRMDDMVKEQMGKGGFALHAPDWMVGGEKSGPERIQALTRGVSNIMLVPFDFTQTAADLSMHRALETMVGEMKQGTVQRASDARALQTLWAFSKADAARMIRGEGTAKQYERVMLTGLSRMSRRGDLPLNKSPFALDRNLPKLIRFTGFFQRQVLSLRQSITAMKEATTPDEANQATAQFAKIIGFNAMAYMAGQSLYKLITGGEEEFFRLWRNSIDDPVSATLATIPGAILGGQGATIGNSLFAAISGSDDVKADAFDSLKNTFLPFAAAADAFEFGNSLLYRRALGKPIGDGPYAGKTPLQQIGYFVGRSMPLARAVENGLFGLGVTYMGTDPQLENAIRAHYAWEAEHAPQNYGRGEDSEERATFQDAMKRVVNRIKAGDSGSEIQEYLRAEIGEFKADRDIASSFRSRRLVSGRSWDRLTPEQQEAYKHSIGEDSFELLRGYDAALTAMSSRFSR